MKTEDGFGCFCYGANAHRNRAVGRRCGNITAVAPFLFENQTKTSSAGTTEMGGLFYSILLCSVLFYSILLYSNNGARWFEIVPWVFFSSERDF